MSSTDLSSLKWGDDDIVAHRWSSSDDDDDDDDGSSDWTDDGDFWERVGGASV